MHRARTIGSLRLKYGRGGRSHCLVVRAEEDNSDMIDDVPFLSTRDISRELKV